MPQRTKIPRPTVKRLSLYLRELEAEIEASNETISSKQLGNALGLTDAQVRKDLAYFGQFGHPGIGYAVCELVGKLREILATDRSWKAAVVGAGNIGRAVTSYARLPRKGFEVVALLDNDPSLIGSEIAGLEVKPITDLRKLVRTLEIKIGMVAVPGSAAQDVADQLVDAGVLGILNFAPVRLQVGDSVAITSVDLTVSLEQLAFKIALKAP